MVGLWEGQSGITAFFSPISSHEDASMSEMEGSGGGGSRREGGRERGGEGPERAKGTDWREDEIETGQVRPQSPAWVPGAQARPERIGLGN